jgi:hypothetical protein
MLVDGSPKAINKTHDKSIIPSDSDSRNLPRRTDIIPAAGSKRESEKEGDSLSPSEHYCTSRIVLSKNKIA